MKKIFLAAALAIAALPVAAQATEKSYTFIEGGYTNVDNDADGAYLRGNYALGKTGAYLTGAYAAVEVDNSEIDLRQGELGLGYRYILNDRFDLTAEAARVRLDTDFGDADGYRASVGTRFDITDTFEGQAQVNHYNGDDFVAENTATVTGLYKFGSRWGVNGTVEFNGDGNEIYSVGFSAVF